VEAVKKAIRSALERGEANDRAFREKVYRQAFSALDRSLQARPGMSAEEVRQRRDQVKAAIVEIERSYLAAVDSAQQQTAPREEPPQQAYPRTEPPAREPDFGPRVEREDRFEEPEVDYAPVSGRREPMADLERTRWPFVTIFVVATLVAAAGIGAWWTMQSGILQSAEERDTSVRTQPVEEEEDFDPGEEAAAPQPAPSQPPARNATAETNGNWLNIFSPSDPTTVSAPAGVTAEAMSEGNTSFLRIGGGGAESAVSFDVGQGLLERLAGTRAIFSLNARTAEGETQVSISCDFGALGGCGRTRYVVGAQPGEYLFEVSLPDETPTGAGRIVVVPDIEGQGRLLDVFSLRVTVEN
jgi:hypothetical protein